MVTARADSYSIASGADLHAGRPAPSPNRRLDLWGQSNCIGRAERSGIAAAPLSSDAELQDYDDSTLPFSRVFIWTGSAYAVLAPGSNAGGASTQFGPEFGLGVRWMRETTDGNLYLHKNAGSGLSITSFEPGVGSRWTIGIRERGEQDDWFAANGVLIGRQHFHWDQGGADRSESQAWYQPRLDALIEAIYSAGVVDVNSRIQISRSNPASSTYSTAVDDAKLAIDAARPDVLAILQPGFYEEDGFHLNARSQVQHAYDVYSYFFDASAIEV